MEFRVGCLGLGAWISACKFRDEGQTGVEFGASIRTWGLIKIMGPFGVCIIVYTLQSRGPKGTHNFDQPPLKP